MRDDSSGSGGAPSDSETDPGETFRSLYEAAKGLQEDEVKDIDRLCEIAVGF